MIYVSQQTIRPGDKVVICSRANGIVGSAIVESVDPDTREIQFKDALPGEVIAGDILILEEKHNE